MPAYNVSFTPAKGDYTTREQLYALCVLLCWGPGLGMSNQPSCQHTVTLMGVDKGNTGLSVYLLEQNPNAESVQYEDVASLPYQRISFNVLGHQLFVEFDEDGVGLVSFPEPFAN